LEYGQGLGRDEPVSHKQPQEGTRLVSGGRGAKERGDAMGKATLVDQDTEHGRRLIEALDQTGFPVVAAFWSFFPEGDLYRLVIASPVVDEKGPREAYTKIQKVLHDLKLSDLALEDITVLSPYDPLVIDVRLSQATDGAPYLARTHMVRVGTGPPYPAYVYRAERIIGGSGVFKVWTASADKHRRVWIAKLGTLTTENGFLKKLEVNGTGWPQTKHGINAPVSIISRIEKRDGQTYGDIQKWTILAGRLRNVETVATDAKLEGLTDEKSGKIGEPD
jgi:hypothetical protein